jgi:hypothetical protein
LLRDLREARRKRQPVATITAQLAEPPIPASGRHLWAWFWELDTSRQSGMAAQSISHVEIRAWARNTARNPSPQDISILQAMDVARLNTFNALSDPDNNEPMTSATPDNVKQLFRTIKGGAKNDRSRNARSRRR